MGLCWDCVDFENGTILINKQLQHEKKVGGKYIFAPLKNDKARRIAPAPWVMQVLKHHRAKQAEQRLKAGPAWENSGLVFTNGTGEHLAIYTVYRDFKNIVHSIGCPNVRFHDLRHTCAGLLLKNGVSMKEVREWLGHSNFSITANIYAHLDTSSKNTSAARMNESFSISPGIRPGL